MINHEGSAFGFNISYQWTTNSVNPSITPMINVINTPRYYQGFIYGFKQPVGCITLHVSAISHEQRSQLQIALKRYFPLHAISLDNEIAVLHSLAESAISLQKSSGMPIFDAYKIEPVDEQTIYVWIPMLFDHCLQDVMQHLLHVYNFHLQTNQPHHAKLIKEQERLLQTLKIHAPQGTNTLHFLSAAHQNNIPWTHAALNNFQYGHGQHSRWLDSSFTDLTPHTSATLITNKRAVNYFLAQQGIPVVEQWVISSEQDAINLANKLNFPVVIKPIDGHGSKGVFTHLMNNSALIQAYRKTRQLTQAVLLEKHIHGKDYRLLVLRGKLIWAIERIPAGVHGDGIHTISELVEINNQRQQAFFPLLHIKITEEAITYLHEQGLELTSIIEKDRFVPLNRSANISMGGTPVAVFDKVHPDNAQLMEAVATLLRLDLVGIDFITTDISRSYREVGGCILEVNVQPQLGKITTAHIYAEILQNLLPEQGRIPIYLIYADKIEPVLNQVKSEISVNTGIGIAMSNAIYLENKTVIPTAHTYAAGKHLLLRNDITALIYCITDENEILQHGLPFDSCTQLFVEKHKLEKNSLIKDTLLQACKERYQLIASI